MKIALYHHLPSGGAKRAMLEMAKALGKRGHIIDEFCPSSSDTTFFATSNTIRHRHSFPFRPNGIFPKRIPFLTPYLTAVRLIGDLLRLNQLQKKIAATIEQNGYDLIFAHDCKLNRTPTIPIYAHIPCFYYCHHGGFNLTPPLIETTSSLLDKIKNIYYFLPIHGYHWIAHQQEGKAFRSATMVLNNSYFSQMSIQDHYGQESQVRYLGVDGEKFKPMGFPKERFFFTVGAVHYHKGYRFLIKAIGKLPIEKRFPLIIAGNHIDSAELTLLQQLANAHQVQLQVKQIHDDQELVRLYCQATLFLYTPICEPWGLSAVEAMACGTAVVAVAEGGMRESIQHNETGMLTPRDETAFAQAIQFLLDHPEKIDALGASATLYARTHFNWEKTAEQLETDFLNYV